MVGRHDAGRAVRSARGTGGAGGSVSRARAINRRELRGTAAGQAAPQRYAHDGHDDHGRADATRSKLGNERCPDRQHAADADAGGSKMIRSRARTGTADAPCFQRVISLFSLCYLLLEKLPKPLIPLSDCPFVLNRLPVFLENLPVSGGKTGPRPLIEGE